MRVGSSCIGICIKVTCEEEVTLLDLDLAFDIPVLPQTSEQREE
jgi:hypothetical protein